MNPVSQFVAIALALTFLVVAVLLWTMLRKPQATRTEAPDEDSARIYREELQELQDAVQSGAMVPADFERARQDLSIRVVQDIPQAAGSTATASTGGGQRAGAAHGGLLVGGGNGVYIPLMAHFLQFLHQRLQSL